MTRKPGIHLRIRLSPATIKAAATVGGRVLETGLGINRIWSAIKLKKSIEKHARLDNRLRTGQGIAEIGTGLATALTNLLSRR